jgi:hypothetical protein
MNTETGPLTYICSNIPLSPEYGVYISQLIWYARTCSTYDQFLNWARILTDKLMLQVFLQSCLTSAFRKFYDRYNDFIYNYFRWAICCLKIFIPIVTSYLAHWLWQQITQHSWSWNWAHGECDRSTGDAYSPRHLLPLILFPGVSRNLLYYGLFHLLELYTGFDCEFLPFTWFDALILTAGSSVYVF